VKRVVVGLVSAALCLAGRAWAISPLEDYGKLPAVEEMQVSPAGDLLAYVATDGAQRVVRVTKVGGPLLANVGVGALKVRGLEWLGEGHVMVEVSRSANSDPGGAPQSVIEIFQTTIIDVATGKSVAVFRDQQHVLPATFGFYGYGEVAGKGYGYFAGVPLEDSGSGPAAFHAGTGYLSSGRTNLYRVDLDTGQGEKIAGGSDLYASHWLVSQQGEVAAHSEYQTKTGDWRLYGDPEDTDMIARATDPTGDYNLLGLGRTEGHVVVEMPRSGAGGDWKFVEYSGEPGSPGEELFAGFTVSSLIHSPRTHLLLGAASTDGVSVSLFDPKLQARWDAVRRAFPGEKVALVSAANDFHQIVVLTTGPGDSGTYFLVDLVGGKASAVGWNYPTILQADVAEAKEVTYKASDGLEIEGVLTLPPGKPAKNLPVVVMPHGGPEARDYVGFDFWAQAFASRGYAVFQPNFRGSDGFGKAFRDAGYGQWGRKMQTDISDGLADLAKQGAIDPKRACIVGASYGGYAALAGVTVQQGLYRCAVSIGGVTDLNDMLRWVDKTSGDESQSLRYWRNFMGAGSIGDPAIAAYSPLRLAAKADAPILLMYGHNDTVVDPQQSRGMAAALKSAGKPVETIELASEDHWLSRQDTRIAAVKASVEFVMKNNPPD